ncbi:hypothetical protein PHYPSEUDO_004218 [Phytophthora pseudosyringae]|uniref:Uncharacterized protein n=1 Tax=Phytophthora pseudosyringae TaxID=221518 RepID=A0A8T1VNN7_9STRA|nr:hypothetical protein PHYPSEUDO_004218 [Phytophthora pseudosyringae]
MASPIQPPLGTPNNLSSSPMLDVHLGLLQYGIADVMDEGGAIVAQRVQVALVLPPRLRIWFHAVSRYLQSRYLYSC